MNINDFARILCDDLELPATHFVPSIVQSIQTQLNEHPRYSYGFYDESTKRIFIYYNL